MALYDNIADIQHVGKILAANAVTVADQLAVFADMGKANMSDGRRIRMMASYLENVQPLQQELVQEVLHTRKGAAHLKMVLLARWEELDKQQLRQTVDSSQTAIIGQVLAYGLTEHVPTTRYPAYLQNGGMSAVTDILGRADVTLQHFQTAVTHPPEELKKVRVAPDVMNNLVRQLGKDTITEQVAAAYPTYWWGEILATHQYSPVIMLRFYENVLGTWLPQTETLQKARPLHTLLTNLTDRAVAARYQSMGIEFNTLLVPLRRIDNSAWRDTKHLQTYGRTLPLLTTLLQEPTNNQMVDEQAQMLTDPFNYYHPTDILHMVETGYLQLDKTTKAETGDQSAEHFTLERTVVGAVLDNPRYRRHGGTFHQFIQTNYPVYKHVLTELQPTLTFEEKCELVKFSEMLDIIGSGELQQWITEQGNPSMREILALGHLGLTLNEMAVLLQQT